MAEISIVIPVYNAAKTLPACLDSIQKQTFRDYEIIAINDGSTDESLTLLQHHGVRTITQANAGAAVARNRGALEATGEYLLFCDADIILKPEMLATMRAALQEHPQAAYTYSGFTFGFKTFTLWEFDEARLKNMPYIHTTSLIRREAFPGFDESLKRFQDWDLWLTMLERGNRGYFINETLFSVKSGGTMSHWLPSFMYKLPFFPKQVSKYKQAMAIIKKKHNLPI